MIGLQPTIILRYCAQTTTPIIQNHDIQGNSKIHKIKRNEVIVTPYSVNTPEYSVCGSVRVATDCEPSVIVVTVCEVPTTSDSEAFIGTEEAGLLFASIA